MLLAEVNWAATVVECSNLLTTTAAEKDEKLLEGGGVVSFQPDHRLV